MAQLTREQLNELADKWLKGTISPEERTLLSEWYDLDSSETIQWASEEPEKELAERMLNNIKKRKDITYPFRKKWQLPAAAVLLITLGITALFYYRQLHLVKEQSTPISFIKPGKNKAVLTLGNGQKISLTDAANGRLAIQNGTYINKTANGQLIYLDDNKTVTNNKAFEYNTIEAPSGGQWQVILPDGSHVWLNSSSALIYPTKFTGKKRVVELKGEAYFEVAHNKQLPFEVRSLGQTVQVLGTHFNVMAYPNDQMVKTTLLEGSVRVSDNGNTKMLKPGQQALAGVKGLSVINNADLEDAVAWKNGYFKFNEDLKGIMKKIARWYDVDIVYKAQPDPTLAFGGKISRSRDIKEVLKIMEYTGKVHFKIEGRRIIVTK